MEDQMRANGVPLYGLESFNPARNYDVIGFTLQYEMCIRDRCEYAFENASGEEELYECIGAVQKQGYRMSRLIESLLAFARLEQNEEAFVPETTDLSLLVEQICDCLLYTSRTWG